MAQIKKILISLPSNLLKEVDSIIAEEKINRSEFVRKAMKSYIREKKKVYMRDSMKTGYEEMGSININLAEEFIEMDEEQYQKYEKRLGELDI